MITTARARDTTTAATRLKLPAPTCAVPVSRHHGDVTADHSEIIDAGVLRLVRKVDVPLLSAFLNTAAVVPRGAWRDDLAYNIAGKVFGLHPRQTRKEAG